MRCCGVMAFYFCETPILFRFTAIEYFFVFHCYVMVFLSYEMEFHLYFMVIHLYFMVIHFYFVMFHFYDTLREWEYFFRLRLQPFWDVWFLFVLDESNTPFRKCQTLAKNIALLVCDIQLEAIACWEWSLAARCKAKFLKQSLISSFFCDNLNYRPYAHPVPYFCL